MTKMVLISDTHCRLRKIEIPEGDVLIHAGDLTFRGDIQEISQELRELETIAKRFSKTIFVPGNHDWLFERNLSLAKEMCENAGITVLQDSGIEFNGLNIWGSAYTPEFCNWAFQLFTEEQAKEKWAQIPDNTDVLITHGPPHGILDYLERFNGLEHLGCKELYARVQDLKQLKLHVFGHIHYANGTIKIGDTTFINAAICAENYRPIQQPYILNVE